jgi:hypothetical protein
MSGHLRSLISAPESKRTILNLILVLHEELGVTDDTGLPEKHLSGFLHPTVHSNDRGSAEFYIIRSILPSTQ